MVSYKKNKEYKIRVGFHSGEPGGCNENNPWHKSLKNSQLYELFPEYKKGEISDLYIYGGIVGRIHHKTKFWMDEEVAAAIVKEHGKEGLIEFFHEVNSLLSEEKEVRYIDSYHRQPELSNSLPKKDLMVYNNNGYEDEYGISLLSLIESRKYYNIYKIKSTNDFFYKDNELIYILKYEIDAECKTKARNFLRGLSGVMLFDKEKYNKTNLRILAFSVIKKVFSRLDYMKTLLDVDKLKEVNSEEQVIDVINQFSSQYKKSQGMFDNVGNIIKVKNFVIK